MKRYLALAVCLMLNGLTVHQVLAQSARPKARSAAARHASGYLGVGVTELDEDRAKALKLAEVYGVEITNIEENSPAAKAGLQVSDVILNFNGQRIEGMEQFVRMVSETPPGRKVNITYSRAGVSHTASTILAERKTPFGPPGLWSFRFPEVPNFGDNAAPLPPTPPRVIVPDTPRALLSWRNATVGIEAEHLNPQLADYFGVKDGVLVRSVARNSPAEKAGLKAGDVVAKVNGAQVSTPREISSHVQRDRGSKAAAFTVIRKGKELTLEVKPSGSWDDSDDAEEL